MSGLSCAKGIISSLDDDDDADDDCVVVSKKVVAVLEAKATIGGRVEQTEDVAPWPVELGAEFVHGEEANPIVRDVVALGGEEEEEEEDEQQRLRFSRFDWPDRYAMTTTTTTTTTEHQQTPTPTPTSFCGVDQLEIVDGDACEKNDAEVWKIHRLFDRLPGVSKTSSLILSSSSSDDDDDNDRTSSLSALEWLRDVQKCTEREIRLAELIYATDFGASLKDIGMREITIEKERWRNGEQYLVLNGGFNELFRRTFTRKFSESGTARTKTRGGSVEVRLNWEVKTVERILKDDDDDDDDDIEGGYIIKVTGTRGGKHQTLYGKKVVVSLPLPIYRPMEDDGCDNKDKKGKKNKEALSRVAFHPPLSEEKRKALRAVKMGNAVKVLLGFSEKFWPQEDLFNVICDYPAPFPEFWVVSDKEKTIRCGDKKTKRRFFWGGGKKKEDVRYVVTFFITGDRANAMAKINPSERIEMAFKQFVGITLRTNDEKEFDRIRKTRLKTSATKVWAEDKFAGGSYTHPSVGCTAKTRADLAKPEWSNTLFFCGEATNTSVNPCLQGAFETGVRAAKEVLSSFKNRETTYTTT